ncbi:MAG: PaaI family thioesterase [Alphaproteobacteria bacterium]|nr:PaaI family thioesterase [Alphaproteobacteria bacterium]
MRANGFVSASGTPLCGGCRGVGRCRLGVGELQLDGEVTQAPVRCNSVYHAGPGVAHGGWTAAVFDDVMGRSLIQRGTATVTASLKVDYLKPVPVDEPLVIEVRVEAQAGRRWELSSTIRLAADDAPLARAEGLWLERRKGHFERHEEAMSAYREGKPG